MEEIIIVLEEWRNITGYSKLQASNIGRVRNTESGIMKPYTNVNGYSCLNVYLNEKKTIRKVHRLVALAFIPNPMKKPTVDHIDSNAKLNNTIENLRWATYMEQRMNTSKQANTSSQYKGVSWSKRGSKWEAYITIDRKRIHLGFFNNEEESALAYNNKAIEHFGEFAKPNVIEHRLAAAQR